MGKYCSYSIRIYLSSTITRFHWTIFCYIFNYFIEYIVIFFLLRKSCLLKKFRIFILLILASFSVFIRVNKIQPTEKNIEVVIVQPNIDPNKKWDYSLREETMTLMDSLYENAISMKPDLIIFPETALPSYLKIETRIRKRLQESK